ncbi:MAG: hypothetical protein REI95_12490, partial [Oxalicibacterium faecigallinarum]|uniref:hypothetical protein n=1 Tax=Oxalicibacterium faecigallinarum TaxID=573741 RepID=UPI002809BE9F
MAGIFGKQSSDRVLQQCLSGCESTKRKCDVYEAQERRQKEMEEARAARAAEQQQATRRQEQQLAQQAAESAEVRQMTQLRQKYPGKMIFRTEQLLTGQDDALPVLLTVDNPQFEHTFIAGHLFYLDRESVLHVVNMKTGARKSVMVPGSFGVTQVGESKSGLAVVKSVLPGERELILQAFDQQAQPVSAQIKTGMPAFVGNKKGEGNRTISLQLRGATLYVHNFGYAYIHEGKDTTPLEA